MEKLEGKHSRVCCFGDCEFNRNIKKRVNVLDMSLLVIILVASLCY